MKEWVEFTYLLKSQYRAIAKGSIVNVDNEQYEVKQINRVILLDESVGEPRTVQLVCIGIKCT